jgi:hypothetical protein
LTRWVGATRCAGRRVTSRFETRPKPSGSKANDGSLVKIEAAAKELKARGYDYSTRSLCDIRQAAAAFPASRRLDAITFWVHVDAGNPDMMDAIVKQAKKDGENVTAAYVRQLVSCDRCRSRCRAMPCRVLPRLHGERLLERLQS